MSNIIPIVSSSPPPLDDNPSYGWPEDDDDDDFGNFASAPFTGISNSGDSLTACEFDADWSQVNTQLTSDSDQSREHTPAKDGIDPMEEEEEKKATDSKREISHEMGTPNHVENGVAESEKEGDSFADFSTFGGLSSSRPTVGSLPLKISGHGEEVVEADKQVDLKINEECGDKSMISSQPGELGMHESTTDSGMFSTDMSPVPKSDSILSDKNVLSEDETFADLPQDAQQISSSFHEEDNHKAVEAADDVISIGTSGLGDSSGSATPETMLNSTSLEESAPSKLSHQSSQELEEVQPSVYHNCHLSAENAEVGVEDVQSPEQRTFNEENCYISSNLSVGCKLEGVETSGTEETDKRSLGGELAQVSAIEAEGKEPGVADDIVQSSSHLKIYKDSHSTEGNGTEISECKEDLSFPADSDVPKDCCVSETFEEKSRDGIRSSDVPHDNNADEEEEDEDEEEEGDDEEWPGFKNSFNHNSDPEDLVLKVGDLKDEHEDNSEDFDDDGTFGQFSSTFNDADLPKSGDEAERKPEIGEQPKCDTEGTNGCIQTELEAVREAGDGEDDDNDEFGDFRGPGSEETSETEKPSAISSSQVIRDETKSDDEFTQLKSEFENSSAQNQSVEDDFGQFPSQTTSEPSESDAGFGGFSSQQAVSDDTSDWANFGEPAKTEGSNDESSDDFGDFAQQEPSFVPMTTSEASSVAHSTIRGGRIYSALANCFPGNGEEARAMEKDQNATEGKDGVGILETIIQFGLNYRAATQQTWKVVEHPSKKDPWVRLWSHLKDIDGTPAVVYQWLKSSCNSQLFKTLHIDTQNMLIGHKKPSVPIFATGLSLLEPIRGSGGEGRNRNQHSRAVSSTLVDPNQQEGERLPQDIPAVDFDWSSSGLTNPLTSKSLDLDFLVVQESEAFEKLSVFESELLDAPRASVKSLQPLEDILKSVKPTSVRNRRDDSSASQMSPEAARIVANLPDLTFMQSKVLMFPIKN